MRHKGFTLIELMIVVIIIAVMMALATPSFRDFFERSRLRGATDDLVTLLNTARAEAVKLDRDVNVTSIGSSTVWCAGAKAAGDPPAPAQPVPAVVACDCTTPSACVVDGKQLAISSSSYDGITVSAIPAAITFDSKQGSLTPVAAGPTVTLTSKNGKYQTQLKVSPLGQTSVCLPAGKPFISGLPTC